VHQASLGQTLSPYAKTVERTCSQAASFATQANMLALERPLAPSANPVEQMMTSMRPHHAQIVL
jgi:hypothetical protein